jgi:hypothetical protein
MEDWGFHDRLLRQRARTRNRRAKVEVDDEDRLRKLAAFAPRLRGLKSFGTWGGGEGKGTFDDPIVMSYYIQSDIEWKFEKMCYRAGWITPCGWVEWSASDIGHRFLNDKTALAEATIGQLHQFLTTILRASRFTEGVSGRYFANGFVLAAAERAQELLRTLPGKT